MKRLLLVGAGHAHAQVLLDWVQAPLPGVELVVVSPQALAPYSGMVPGWLAGHYRYEQIVIDFAALCAAAGARWVEAGLERLDADAMALQLSSGETLGCELLSLNVGSTLRPPTSVIAHALPMRPLSALRSEYEARLAAWAGEASTAPYTVTAVGGGAAGFESLLAVLARLRRLRPDRPVEGRLVSRGGELLPDLSRLARWTAARALAAAGVTVQLGADGADAAATSDLLLWATGAQAHGWQLDPARRGGLAVSGDGFVRIDAQLRSLSHPRLFAVGDCAHWDDGPQGLPKAGVYAVRMGPVLTHNLRAVLAGGALQSYRPQRRFLALLATADGRAIASRGAFGASGAWAWRWKDHIDRHFVRRFAAPRRQLGLGDPR